MTTRVAINGAAGRMGRELVIACQRNEALTLAADRVEQKFGFRCSSAETQLLAIETRGRQFAGVEDARVTVTRIG